MIEMHMMYDLKVKAGVWQYAKEKKLPRGHLLGFSMPFGPGRLYVKRFNCRINKKEKILFGRRNCMRLHSFLPDFLKYAVKNHAFIPIFSKKNPKKYVHFYWLFQNIWKNVCIFIDYFLKNLVKTHEKHEYLPFFFKYVVKMLVFHKNPI